MSAFGSDPAVEVVRSEEELRVETRTTPIGRVRLTRRVVVETVTETHELRHETLEVERLAPDGDASASAAPIASESFEILLRREELRTAKVVVPYERVRVVKDVETGTQAVEATLHQERVEVDERR